MMEIYEEFSRDQLIRRIAALEAQAKVGLRDEFAKHALVGIMSSKHFVYFECTPQGIASDAYALADAMMEARKS